MTSFHTKRIEEILSLETNNSALQSEFYHLIMNYSVFVLGCFKQPYAKGSLQADITSEPILKLFHWSKSDGSIIVPFFTSKDRLRELIPSTDKRPCLQLTGRSLFSVAHHVPFCLNPHVNAKEFTTTEIQSLLNMDTKGVFKETYGTKDDHLVISDELFDYPTKMVDALTQWLPRFTHVNRAYLVSIDHTSKEIRPHFTVGIEANGDVRQVIEEMGGIIEQAVLPGIPVQVYHMGASSQHDALSEYFIHSVEPFYERSWGQKIQPWLTPGHA